LDNQDDEEDNPDLKNDPIYQTDIKSYLVEFFRTCNSQNVNSFGEVCQNYLNDDEKNLLQHILS
jgi:hypothetical protein